MGARNYAAVDYGTHYIKEGEALNFGGAPISTTEALAQTESFLALQEERYRQQGLYSNLFDLNNPYSTAANLALTQTTHGGGHKKALALAGELFSSLGKTLDFSREAQAQTEAQKELKAQLLYPGQETVVGFTNYEAQVKVYLIM